MFPLYIKDFFLLNHINLLISNVFSCLLIVINEMLKQRVVKFQKVTLHLKK